MSLLSLSCLEQVLYLHLTKNEKHYVRSTPMINAYYLKSFCKVNQHLPLRALKLMLKMACK